MDEPEADPVYTVRFAEDDEDIIEMHRFLMVEGQSQMRCPIDFLKSLKEVERVAKNECAVMLLADGKLVGTMAIMKVTWWYGFGEFMVDRWNFTTEEHRHSSGAREMWELIVSVANGAGLELIHYGKIRGKKHGALRMMPTAYTPESVPEQGSAEAAEPAPIEETEEA